MFSNNNFQFLNNITRIFIHFFHSHVFSHMFSNNNFQFLNAYTKHYPLGNSHMEIIQERANTVPHPPYVKVDFDVGVKQ